MHYFIDGYNLMFRFLGADDDLESQRQEIIDDLQKKINFLNIDATLVFDAQHQNTQMQRSHINSLELIFTNVGETADEFIIQALKEEKCPMQHTVVTSDNKLAWLARRRHAKTESVETFVSWLNRRYKNRLRAPKFSLPQPIVKVVKKQPSDVPSLPHDGSTTEECFDFYLTQFETSLQQQTETTTAAKDAKKATSKKSPSRKKKEQSPKEEEHSNMERWLKAFQRNPEEFH